jgi:glutathione-S-conjugate glycine hydrolase
MRVWTRRIAVAATLAIVGAGIAVWDLAFRAPAQDPLPLPPALIAAESPAGQSLLVDRAYLADYESLRRAFEPQSRRAYCGVASAVIVLNALRGSSAATQSNFFTDAASGVRNSLQVTFGGMSLGELAALLRAHGVDATAHYASNTTVDQFRTLASQNLATPGDYLLVNYQRAALGQEKIGHISPVAAYNAAADRFLLFDVASYHYPPVWVSTEALWQAMNTIDDASGRTRGFIVVKAAQ